MSEAGLLADPAEVRAILVAAAIQPDVALFHARWADRAGNVWIGRRRELATIAHAAPLKSYVKLLTDVAESVTLTGALLEITGNGAVTTSSSSSVM